MVYTKMVVVRIHVANVLELFDHGDNGIVIASIRKYNDRGVDRAPVSYIFNLVRLGSPLNHCARCRIRIRLSKCVGQRVFQEHRN